MIFSIVPVPASRARVTKRGAFYAKPYEQFRKDMKVLKLQYKQNILSGALAYKATFYCPIPKSITIKGKKKTYTKAERAEMNGMPAVQAPDLDNLTKAILDSLEGWFFENDKQFCKDEAEKIYSVHPRIEIDLYILN